MNVEKKDVEQENADVVESKEEEKVDESQEEMKEVAAQVEKVLVDNNYAIQPYLVFSQEGIVPSVRLVKVNQSNEENESQSD